VGTLLGAVEIDGALDGRGGAAALPLVLLAIRRLIEWALTKLANKRLGIWRERESKIILSSEGENQGIPVCVRSWRFKLAIFENFFPQSSKWHT